MFKHEVFLCFFALSVFFPQNLSAETRWKGTNRFRHLIQVKDDGLKAVDSQGRDTSRQTLKAYQLRADLNVFNHGEALEWGLGFRTSSSSTSEWINLQDNQDPSFQLENAYFRWNQTLLDGELSITAGRGKTILLFDTIGQALFDKDNRFDGFGWSWRRNGYGIKLTQYVLGSRNLGSSNPSFYSETEATKHSANQRGNFAVLYSFQPNLRIEISPDVVATFALGYHLWGGTSGRYTNQIHGGNPNSMAGIPIGNVDPVIMDNARQIQLYSRWNLPFSMNFLGEYIQNKKVFYGNALIPTDKPADNQSLALTLFYGEAKKAGTYSLAYSYVRKGIGSTINAYSNSEMPADNNGHLMDVQYAPMDALIFLIRAEFFRELAKLGGNGVPLAAPYQDRLQTTSRYEFITYYAF